MINFRKFTINLAAYSVILFAVYALFAWLAPDFLVSEAFYFFVPFFFLLALLSKYILARITQKRDKLFSQVFLAINMARFLLYIGIILFYAFSRPDDAVAFIITFFVFYFLFTIFEVMSVYRDLHNRKNP